MSSLAIAGVVFGCAFLSALVGMVVKLPPQHQSSDSKDVVKLVLGLIGTIAALVLSLLIASANSSYNAQASELQSLSANVILLDRLLVSYGPETKDARDRLRDTVVTMHDRIWSPSGVQALDLDGSTRFINQLQSLATKTDAQRSMQGHIMQIGESLVQTRLLMFEQLSNAISWPVLVVLVGWICTLFLGFGLFARFNPTIAVALLLGAICVSGAIFLILELNEPYRGLLRISDTPLLNALAQIKR